MKESKREKFKRLAENRTNKILDMLDLLGNCSNKNVYDYSDREIKIIFSGIEDRVKETKQLFKTKTANRKIRL